MMAKRPSPKALGLEAPAVKAMQPEPPLPAVASDHARGLSAVLDEITQGGFKLKKVFRADDSSKECAATNISRTKGDDRSTTKKSGGIDLMEALSAAIAARRIAQEDRGTEETDDWNDNA
eukprot:scaffold19378_cov32-Tisochrysis_lutea.AAC.1